LRYNVSFLSVSVTPAAAAFGGDEEEQLRLERLVEAKLPESKQRAHYPSFVGDLTGRYALGIAPVAAVCEFLK